MRRNSTLVVDTTTTSLKYDLDASPRSSIFSPVDLKEPAAFETPANDALPPIAPTTPSPSIQPSIRLLFSLLSRRDVFVLLIPAILTSLVAGGVAPFMTYVTGQAFAAFAEFPHIPNPTEADKHKLLNGVGLASIELVALGVGAFVLSSITSSFWIWTGEKNTMAIRQRVYQAVSEKDLSWFDTKMGQDNSEGPLGAGGMMAKFTRETDDVRTATSLAAGYLVQYITTCLACLLLAFIRSWSLTLVILSAVPILVIVQSISQKTASPLLAGERAGTATAASLLDRVINAISTVKAFNAEEVEHANISRAFEGLKSITARLNAVWGFTSCISQFTSMAMFVQGFWFGSKLVRDGKINAGDVMAVFWACLIATNNLQMCIPQLIALAKGKFAMASLMTLVHESPSHKKAFTTVALTPNGTNKFGSRRHSLRKIKPQQCHGEVSLHNITFTYPTLSEPTLKDVSLFLPGNEMTFIVGSSGSGKSTIAALLMHMYAPDVGHICLDETDIRYLDDNWLKTSICGVGQGWSDVILEGATFADNVRLGLEGVGEREVEDACRAALLHDFIRDLPDGYDTVLGGVGVALSGGQRQRLAIARAKLRNPPVLVLDEATSALDATSRLLVFEAIKTWRRNKTTIVITHDLSQVEDGDFVYVMKNGVVVEQGFRCDLEQESISPIEKPGVNEGHGEFRKMLDIQLGLGGCLPTKDIGPVTVTADFELPAEQEDRSANPEEQRLRRHQTLLRPLTFGHWMLEAVADLTAPAPAYTATAETTHETSRQSPTEETYVRQRRPSSLHIEIPPAPLSAVEREHSLKRLSLPFTPTSPVFTINSPMKTRSRLSQVYGKDVEFGTPPDLYPIDEKFPIYGNPAHLESRRQLVKKRREILSSKENLLRVTVEKPTEPVEAEASSASAAPAGLFKTFAAAFPTFPYKPLFFLGLAVCALSGAMTPIFSYLLSRLLYETAIGAHNISTINMYGGIVLAIAAFDGFLLGSKFFIMESLGMAWVTDLRKRVLSLILKQDRSWFDKADNSSIRLVQTLVKDGDDARNLIAVVAGQCFVVVSMLGVGLIWALVRGWELTFVGFAIAPVFATVMAIQTKLVAGCEMRNKKAREEVAKGYYEAICNVKGIRAMAFEHVYQARFDKATSYALSTGVKGAFVEGCTFGVASGLIYLAEALLFYVGAILIAKGRYSYLQMVEVLNLVVFTVTIGSQLMAFTQRIAKATQATGDFLHLLEVSKTTPAEANGSFHPQFDGSVSVDDVTFAYPERPDATVLHNVSLTIAPGECVAIVGSSGSGKSTLAALLQRLYEPSSGQILLGTSKLSDINVHHLREHLSVVSQHPYLFDATVSENIKYGSHSVTEVDVRHAAKAANAHEFVMSLPKGYDTHVGENAGLISGGQAQRLAIARALARSSDILILDECTSALDPENQRVVMEAISKVVGEGAQGRTTIMVTHKLQVMQKCDRIIVMDGGEVKEQGSYDELISRKGTFASLARGGEWMSD